MKLPRILLALVLILTFIGLADAQHNAALTSRGARIEMGSDSGLNERWNKVEDLIRDEEPAGPLLNDLASGRVSVYFPFNLHVRRIGLTQSDYKNTFAKAQRVEVVTDAGTRTYRLENRPGEMQWLDVEGGTTRLELRVNSVYAPENGDVAYGGFSALKVLVEEDLDELFKRPDDYVSAAPFVMPTHNSRQAGESLVSGRPRKAAHHPLTIWDTQDIAEIKAQVEVYPEAREAYESIVRFCEQSVREPIPVPDEPYDGIDRDLFRQHNAVATGIANLGIGYALSGNEDYARQARRMLLALSERYEGWPLHQHPQFTHDQSKWSYQRLDDAIWLIPAAWGYDLIHNSPSLSDADRKQIEQQFIMPCVENIMRSSAIIHAPTNWSVICNAAVMIGSRVCGDERRYRQAIHGLTGKKDGGIYYHLDKGIDEDGLWSEGTMSYQFMAMRGLLVCAEILWRDGIDIYSYQNGRMKKLFDSPLWYAYPGGEASPAIHDSSIISLFGRDAHLYQYAIRRYGDQTYNGILHKIEPSLASVYNLFLPAFDFRPVEATQLPEVPSVLFPGVGFAIARTGNGDDSRYLLMDYGPHRSHGHPDKLNFNLFGLGQEIFADPGIAWYATDVYLRYYKHTLAHNTVSYDGQNQAPAAGRLEAYIQRGDIAVIRASTDQAIPSTILDRTLVQTGDRVIDIMHVRSGVPFTFDLPYHGAGDVEVDIATREWTERPAEANGFKYFADAQIGTTDQPWQADWSIPRGQAVLRYMPEPGTHVVTATTPRGDTDVGTAMVRRRTNRTTFAGVIDLVPRGEMNPVDVLSKVGDSDEVYGIRADGERGYDQVMVAYDGEAHAFGDWQTDARTAMVRVVDGILAQAVIAGGSTLEGLAQSIVMDRDGLLVYRAISDELAELSNGVEYTTVVELAGFAWASDADLIGADGHIVRSLPVNDGQLRVELAGMQRVELRRGDQPRVEEYEDEQRALAIEAAIERDRLAEEKILEHLRQQQADADAKPLPEGYFVLKQAEDIEAQGGGKVSVNSSKIGSFGQAFSGWNDRGHWLEYKFKVDHPGYYQVVFKYCREGKAASRSLQIDGETPTPAAELFAFPGTGGWSNGSDEWAMHQLAWPQTLHPALIYLEPGEHTLRLINNGGDGGVNLDYIVFARHDLPVGRDVVEK